MLVSDIEILLKKKKKRSINMAVSKKNLLVNEKQMLVEYITNYSIM